MSVNVANAAAVAKVLLPLIADVLKFVREYNASKGTIPTLAEVTADFLGDSQRLDAEIDAFIASHPDEAL